MNGCKLREVDAQLNIVVFLHQLLKVSAQVQQAVKKVNDMLAIIAIGFEYRDRIFCCNCIGHW